MFNKNLVKKLFIVLTLLIIVLAALEARSFITSTSNTKIVSDTKEIGPYKVSINQNDLEKEIEKDLKEALESKNSNDILKGVSRYFVADYFSLNDKESINDIGGIGFVLKNNRSEFKTNAINSYYGDLPAFQEVYGAENLPEVSEVTSKKPQKHSLKSLNIKKNKNFKPVSAHSVNVSWKYQENEVLETKNIVNSAKIIFVKADDGNYYIFALEGVE